MKTIQQLLVSAWRAVVGNTIRTFGIVGVLLLLVLAIAPAKDHFSQWHGYQNDYLAMIHNRGDAISLRRRFVPGIQQIWLPELGVVDRCATCHQGLREATLADGIPQPFRRHPSIPHPIDAYGCVICHRGQGPATSVEEAHASQRSGEDPILPARYIESGCGQCHQNTLTGTPQLNLGRQSLARYGCVNCHTVKTPDGTVMKATDNPPSLEHLADKTTREWVYTWLKNPQAYAASATMPNYKLSDADAGDLSAFLISSSKPLAGDTDASLIPLAKNADPSAGAVLYGESFCATCHAVQNAAGNLVGGDIGPELTRVGNKVKPAWLQAWIQNPRTYNAHTLMPRFRFTPQQVATLTTYLTSKSDSDYGADVHLSTASAAQIAHGRKLVVELGCAACHTINGVKKPENFGPDLSRIGSKPLAQLIFLPGMQQTLPTYIRSKIKQPDAFGAGMKMPLVPLNDAQRDALTTALLALSDRSQTMPEKLRVAAVHPSTYEPAGPAGKLMDELACMSCHRFNGHGSDLAPDLSYEGSAVQAPWLNDFLKNPNTLRPALTRRMPRFNLSDADRKLLTDYIMVVYQSPTIDPDKAPPAVNPPALVDQGRQLFYSRYACQSCHVANTQTDKGYIGPVLTQVGLRLTPAWIYAWLKDPQALRPGTIEPNQNISDADARAITAFLMTLKTKQEIKQ